MENKQNCEYIYFFLWLCKNYLLWSCFCVLQVQGGGNAGNALTCAARLGLNPRIISKVFVLFIMFSCTIWNIFHFAQQFGSFCWYVLTFQTSPKCIFVVIWRDCWRPSGKGYKGGVWSRWRGYFFSCGKLQSSDNVLNS